MINKVTFTGIDNKTKVEDLVELYNKYPFVEFGVLISANNTNNNIDNKYPNLVILKSLKTKNLPLSLHVCGSIAHEIIQHNNWQPLYNLIGEYLPYFSRIQLNVSALNTFSTEVEFPKTHTFILQTKSDKLDIYNTYKNVYNVVGFQDNSGGTGKVENNWMITEDKYFGYAGGIGPDNVIEIVTQLALMRPRKLFWIDMETKVRNDKNWFDIKKCQQVCEQLVETKFF